MEPALPETGLVIAPTSALGAMPTYPLPEITETAAQLPTSTPPPTALPTAQPSATQPPLPTPSSSPAPAPTQEIIPPAPQPTEEPIQDYGPSGSQRNILVIAVDDLYAQETRLISVWLVLSVTGTPHFTLMPLYPQVYPQDMSSPLPDSLAQSFALNASGEPSSAFLEALEERGAWWNATILLDQTVVDSVIDIAYHGEHLPGKEAILPAFSPDPQHHQDTLLAQAWLGQMFCQNLADPARDEAPQLFNLLSMIPAHMRTDLDLKIIREELKSILAQSAAITCEIPVLSGGGVEP